MKKIIFVCLLVFVVGVMCSCFRKADYSEYISQLRTDILQGENENYSVQLYLEERETPYLYDGVVGNKEFVVITKLTPKSIESGEILLSFTTDKEYKKTFAFEPQVNSFVATISVKDLPKSGINISIIKNESSENIQLNSIIQADIIDYDTALDTVVSEKSELINSLSNESGLNAEINVRILSESNNNFWYVGIIDKKNTYAFLINAKNGKIIAEKTLQNTDNH